MDSRITTFTSEMMTIKKSFERLFDKLDRDGDTDNAAEAFKAYETLMQALGQGLVYEMVANIRCE